MTADIRTAAQRGNIVGHARSRAEDKYASFGTYKHAKVDSFIDGAVWAQARVTPTREQVAIALAKQKARDWDSMTGVMHIAAIHAEYFNADAVLALMQELAEGENSAN